MNPRRRATRSLRAAICILGVVYVASYLLMGGLGLLEAFSLFNILASLGLVLVCIRALLGNADPLFSLGAVLLVAGNVFWGQRVSPDALTSGAVLLTGLVTLYVGLKIGTHVGFKHLAVFVSGYLLLFYLFTLRIPNADSLFVLSLLGLSATARDLRLTAYFWAVVTSFTLCQPYAWESVIAFFLILTALFGARGFARSGTTLIFLAGGLLLILTILFPILILMLGQDLHSLSTLLGDPRIRSALVLTLTTATVSSAVLFATITPLAYATRRLHFPGKELLVSLMDLPIVIPQSAAGIALLSVFGRKQFLGGLLGERFGLYFDGTVLGIVVAQLFVAMPFMAKSALAAFEAVDEEFETVAATLGCPPLASFCRIALPLAARGLAGGVVLSFARAAGEFGALLFLAPTPETAPIAVFNRFTSMGISEAAPLVSLLLLFSLALFFLLQLATRLLPGCRPAGAYEKRRQFNES
ncbi:MAG: ABC transporter permease [Kiritimatiellae bacterium]|nr:ABC transporter permease [Kiritimatiellia bacterium]